MHVPLSTALMGEVGEAAGEADFEVRVVTGERDPTLAVASGALGSENTPPNVDIPGTEADTIQLGKLSLEEQKEEQAAGSLGALDGQPHATQASVGSPVDRFRWDRKRNDKPGQGAGEVLEKRAWVIVPGMGHIG